MELRPGDRPYWELSNPLTAEPFLGTLDRLHGETGLPIHLTEISAKFPDATRRGELLEMIFRLGFSHERLRRSCCGALAQRRTGWDPMRRSWARMER
jgi:hypothetical protein